MNAPRYRKPEPSAWVEVTDVRGACAGLPPVRLRDLRHPAASLLLAQNAPARVVMEILGHSQIALTMNTYSHVAPKVSREAADRMARMLWESAEDDTAEVLEDAE